MVFCFIERFKKSFKLKLFFSMLSSSSGDSDAGADDGAGADDDDAAAGDDDAAAGDDDAAAGDDDAAAGDEAFCLLRINISLKFLIFSESLILFHRSFNAVLT